MEKALMECLGFEPGTAGRKEQANPLSYSSQHILCLYLPYYYVKNCPLKSTQSMMLSYGISSAKPNTENALP